MSHQKTRPTIEELHSLFHADYEKGLLFWKQRPIEMFKTKRSHTTWNVRFSNKQALDANHKDGYKHGRIFEQPYLAHRILFAMKHNYWPEYIDHINGIRSDNRIENLRSVNMQQNACNTKLSRKNTSGCIGVSWNERDKRWTAYINANNKRKALGNFIEFNDAVICRKAAQQKFDYHPNHGRQDATNLSFG
jgi:hypothetical protein